MAENEETISGPSLPPALAEIHHESVDEVVKSMKQHPFFMTSQDEIEDPDNPTVEALKALADEGSVFEIADNCREQGNECYKARRWRDALTFYMKGTATLTKHQEGKDAQAKAREERGEGPLTKDEEEKEREEKEKLTKLFVTLYNNRAACNLELSTSLGFHLPADGQTDRRRMPENYRKVIIETSVVRSHDPNSTKAIYRYAQAQIALQAPEKAIALIHEAGSTNNGPGGTIPEALHSVLSAAEKAQQEQARRKAATEARLGAQQARTANLLAALTTRGIRFDASTKARCDPGSASDNAITDLPDDARPRLADPNDPTSALSLPILLLYPLESQSDFVKQVDVTDPLLPHLEYVLPPPWATSSAADPLSVMNALDEYTVETVDCYVVTSRSLDSTGNGVGVGSARRKGKGKGNGLVKLGKKVPLISFLSQTQRQTQTQGNTIIIENGLLSVIIIPKSKAKEWILDWKLKMGIP